MKTVLILGIDTFAPKNIWQIETMADLGYEFVVATTDRRANSNAVWKNVRAGTRELCILSPNPIRRLAQVNRLLRRGPYNHVELYAGGRFVLAYIPLLRYHRCRWIVVERGDIGSIDSYPAMTKTLIELAYRSADAIWYKEPYMAPLLRDAGAKRLFFIPNAASIPTNSDDTSSRHLDRREVEFLWANRFVSIRHSDWVVRAAQERELSKYRMVMLGLQEDALCDSTTLALQKNAREVHRSGFELHPFVDPAPWYRRSRFFLLPARFVFGNNALLEAMAHGVVPIVTKSPGIEMLVTDGENGFVSDANEEAFRTTMLKAATLDEGRWQHMSSAAIETIATKFGLKNWSKRMHQMYEELTAC